MPRRKAARRSSGSRRNRAATPTSAYRKTAKRLGKLSPAMKKLASKKRLTAADKSKISKLAKSARNLSNLHVLKPKEAKAFERVLVKGTNAVQLRNTETHAKVRTDGNDLIVTSNGRTWIYWQLPVVKINTEKKLYKAVQDAFAAKFPLETISELAGKAFKTLDVQAVSLWTKSGRIDASFSSLKQFDIWLYEHYRKTTLFPSSSQMNEDKSEHPSSYIVGLAILVKEPPRKKTAKERAYEGRGEMG